MPGTTHLLGILLSRKIVTAERVSQILHELAQWPGLWLPRHGDSRMIRLVMDRESRSAAASIEESRLLRYDYTWSTESAVSDCDRVTYCDCRRAQQYSCRTTDFFNQT